MKTRILVSAWLLGIAFGCSAPSPSNDVGPLEGAWRLTGLVSVDPDGTRTSATPQESLFLFHDGHYSMAYAFGDARAPAYAELFAPSADESLARFGSMTVNTGTYEVSGTTATLRPMFALVPEFVDGLAEHEFQVTGDNLILTWRRTMSSSRVEQPFTSGGGVTELSLTRVR